MMSGFMKEGRRAGWRERPALPAFPPTQARWPRSVTCRPMSPSRVRWVAVSAAALLILIVLARPYFAGLSFVVRAADLHGAVRRAADLETQPSTERGVTIAARAGSPHGR